MSALSFADNIPAILKKRSQWVVWKQVQVPGRMKPTKVPFSARTGAEASSTDADTWSSFEHALAYYRSHPDVAGIGFVFSERDPYCGIDLDECIRDGQISPEAQALINDLASYSEISPSGTGVKIIIVGTKPEEAKCQSRQIKGMSRIEIYDHARFFTITGQTVAGTPNQIIQQQDKLTALCKKLWPQKVGVDLTAFVTPPAAGDVDMALRERRCLAYLEQCPDAISGQGGHDATLRAACECVRFDLDDAATWRVMQQFNARKTGGETWTDKELAHKIASARAKVQADGEVGVRLRESPPAPAVPVVSSVSSSSPAILTANPCCIIDLVAKYPAMRPPLIHGLMRQGETANLIAAPKVGKSWMSLDLAISLARGGMFLDTFACEPGSVLLIDNELHPETLADRMPKVIAARGLDLATVGKNIFVESLRGQLRDLPGMESYFRGIAPGRFALVICDAFYRFLPGGMDENDNGAMAGLYNLIDRYAAITGSAFVLIHHTSKGDQSQKSVTDVGSGAGAQSRAPDAHIALRRHEEDGCAVLQAEVRSWQPPDPLCLRWKYPLWKPDPSLDPTALRSPGSRRAGRPPKEEPADPWTPARFVELFITTAPRSQAAILAAAEGEGLTSRRAKKMLTLAEERGLVHRWRQGSANRADYATVPQPARGGDAASLSHARTPHTPQGNAA